MNHAFEPNFVIIAHSLAAANVISISSEIPAEIIPGADNRFAVIGRFPILYARKYDHVEFSERWQQQANWKDLPL